MGESADKKKVQKLHLRFPEAMSATFQPTGCRHSPEAEAAWRLHAAVSAARELLTFGELPIFHDLEDMIDSSRAEEIHVPLPEEDVSFLTEVSETEGGSRSKLVRLLLLTCDRVVKACPKSLTSEGLVREILRNFPHS